MGIENTRLDLVNVKGEMVLVNRHIDELENRLIRAKQKLAQCNRRIDELEKRLYVEIVDLR